MHDAVIIGSGAGGGAVAWRLAAAGWRVLGLEKGPRYTRHDYRHAPRGLQPGEFIPKIEDDPHTVVTRRTTAPVRTTLGWIATCVGGGTVHMGGYFYRFHPDDFRMRSRFGDYHGIADWPYGYDELEPYYALAERLMGVSGIGGSDPFAGPRSAPYPMPPLAVHPVAEQLEAACRRRGWHPFPTPRAINSQSYDGRPACEYCTLCASYGCPVGARGTAQETFIAHAERTGRCEVRPLSMVCAIARWTSSKISALSKASPRISAARRRISSTAPAGPAATRGRRSSIRSAACTRCGICSSPTARSCRPRAARRQRSPSWRMRSARRTTSSHAGAGWSCSCTHKRQSVHLS